MRIHHILGVFVLIFVISCQSPQPEEKEVLFDSTKNLTDQTSVPAPDTSPDTIINNIKTEGPDSNFIQRKRDQGIDFFATGTEPFWSIDMDFEKQFSFKTMDDFTLNTPSTDPMRSKNPNIIRYRASVESGEIIISIQKKECINQMSGFKSPYEVIIRAKSSVEKDFTEYKGCGRYTNNSGIADKPGQSK
jgi:uncharacterized membrane protein